MPITARKNHSSDFKPFRIEWGKASSLERPLRRTLTPQEKLLSCDLSWLQFNDRVLSEADDPSVPPLERLRFCAIVSSNLDEFFMVRVAEIARLARRLPGRRFPDGLSAAQTLAQIREQVLRQKARQAAVLERVLDALKIERIHIYKDFEQDRGLDEIIRRRLPELKICLRRSTEPLPALPSARIHIFVRFPGEYAIVTIEEREQRLLELPRRRHARRYALVERWLSARASDIFPDREVIEAFPFKIIRDADLRYRPDDEENLEEQIIEAVENRQRAKVVRLEVDAPSYSEGALFLSTALGLDSAGIYRFDLPLDLRTLAILYNIKSAEHLRYPPIQPQIPVLLRESRDIFDVIRRHDILLHHPYDSFDIVVRFLDAAASDPKVSALYHTIYRTTREALTLQALQRAARRGKKAAVYVEIKARFDELNNLRWASELRDGGVRVVRPLGRYKVHSKLTRVVRREGDRELSFLHLGTGNYHQITARQYTDLGILTCDQGLGREVESYFSALARGRRPRGFRELMVAPGNLHGSILKLIRAETNIQLSGGRGHIIAKMNSLVDPDIIAALYEASSAGVKVELVVRGICCLIPGIKGLSENIRVISIIDRFLEHSRIYYFQAGGEDKIYLSSADWMPRNFYTRYEIAFPVKDPILKRYIRSVILAGSLADNTKAWTLRSDGSYVKLRADAEVGRLRSQMLFETIAKRGYRDTILEER